MGSWLSSGSELERMKQQVAVERKIGKKRMKLSKNMPGKSNAFPKGVNAPSRLLISLFGETGTGKTSLINSLRYAIEGGLENQQIIQSANPNHQGAHSRESLEVVLTDHLSVIDNPGINCEKILNGTTQDDVIRHMEGRYQKGTVTWQSLAPRHENEEDKKSYCSVMVFSATNVNVAREYRGFIHRLRDWQGRFPLAVITHVDKDSPDDVRLALESGGIGDIYEVANITSGKNGVKWVPGRMRKLMWFDEHVALVKWRLAGMLPREWRMCMNCVRVSPNLMTGVIICAAPRNKILGAL